jgi:cell shape-determining protein MreC
MIEQEKQVIRNLLNDGVGINAYGYALLDALDERDREVERLKEENQRLRKSLEDLNQFSRSIIEQDIIDKALGEEN